MKVLITGGAGFIGSHLADACVAKGYEVAILDDLSYGKEDNLTQIRDKVAFHHGSILDPDILAKAIDGCQVVFHMAAVSSVAESLKDPLRCHEVNATGTLAVFDAARNQGAKVVFSSSAAVYGEQRTMPVDENMRTGPISLYGAQKLQGEHYAQVYADLFALPIVCLRYFNVFGPRQDPGSPYSGVVSIFANRFSAGQDVTIYGDGKQTRDFVFVADIVRANLLAATHAEADGHIFNIGTGRGTTILQVAEEIKSQTKSAGKISFAEARAGDIRESRADISRANGMLGYQPETSIEQGLSQLLKSR